jgi:hypothetical protein
MSVSMRELAVYNTVCRTSTPTPTEPPDWIERVWPDGCLANQTRVTHHPVKHVAVVPSGGVGGGGAGAGIVGRRHRRRLGSRVPVPVAVHVPVAVAVAVAEAVVAPPVGPLFISAVLTHIVVDDHVRITLSTAQVRVYEHRTAPRASHRAM